MDREPQLTPRRVSWGASNKPPLALVDELVHSLECAANLLREMSEQAEDAYCASWENGTATGLWRAVLNAPNQPEEHDGWGYENTTRLDAENLWRLAMGAGCWWTQNEQREIVMVPLSEWMAEHGVPEWLPPPSWLTAPADTSAAARPADDADR